MIEHLILTNFRNFDFLEQHFERFNIIKGENGAGKTNLLEAIYFSLNGHPFAKDLKRVQKDTTKPTYLTCKLTDHTIQIVVQETKKSLKLNGKPTTIVELKKLFPCIGYSINSFISFKNKDYLFSLIDRGIFAKDEGIINEIIEYRKLQRTRKNIIKSEKPDKKLLNIVNKNLTSKIEHISNKRKEFIKQIKEQVGKYFFDFYNKKLDLEYNIGPINKSRFKEELYKKRLLISLKKDSLSIKINGMDIFRFSSVGEKKVALLCIVLSIVKVYNAMSKETVFLVDDLEGDLDRSTQEKAFEMIETLPDQIFLTTLGAYSGYNAIDIGG